MTPAERKLVQLAAGAKAAATRRANRMALGILPKPPTKPCRCGTPHYPHRPGSVDHGRGACVHHPEHNRVTFEIVSGLSFDSFAAKRPAWSSNDNPQPSRHDQCPHPRCLTLDPRR